MNTRRDMAWHHRCHDSHFAIIAWLICVFAFGSYAVGKTLARAHLFSHSTRHFHTPFARLSSMHRRSLPHRRRRPLSFSITISELRTKVILVDFV